MLWMARQFMQSKCQPGLNLPSAMIEIIRWISENERPFLNKFVTLTDSLSEATSAKEEQIYKHAQSLRRAQREHK